MLTMQTIQQAVTDVFFHDDTGKHVYVWGDIDTSQRSQINSGTICYVSPPRYENWTYPRSQGNLFIKQCFTYIDLKFVGADSIQCAEFAHFMVQNTLAKSRFRELGAEILGVSNTMTVPVSWNDNNMTYGQQVTVKLLYTMVVETDAERLRQVDIGGMIR